MKVCKNCFYWHKSGLCLKKFLPVGFLYSCENFWQKDSPLYLPIKKKLEKTFARAVIKEIINQWLKKGFCVPPVPVEIKTSSSQSVSISVEDFLKVLKFLLGKKIERKVYLKELTRLIKNPNPSSVIRRNGKFFYF